MPRLNWFHHNSLKHLIKYNGAMIVVQKNSHIIDEDEVGIIQNRKLVMIVIPYYRCPNVDERILTRSLHVGLVTDSMGLNKPI